MSVAVILVVLVVCAVLGVCGWCIARHWKSTKQEHAGRPPPPSSSGNESGSLKSNADATKATSKEAATGSKASKPTAKSGTKSTTSEGDDADKCGDDGENSKVEVTTNGSGGKSKSAIGTKVEGMGSNDIEKPPAEGTDQSTTGEADSAQKDESIPKSTGSTNPSEITEPSQPSESNAQRSRSPALKGERVGPRKREKDTLIHGMHTDITMAEPGTMH